MASKEKNVLYKIHENYNYLNKMMVEEMDIATEHGGLTGNHREEMWMRLFRGIIPQKYSMAQGVMIIDSDGNVSNEVDIAVFDEQYTPYVFQYNTLKFIPIEAVALVIECKSSKLPARNLKEWSESIDKLKTKSSGIARIVSGYASGLTNRTQKKTRPIKILASNKGITKKQYFGNRDIDLGDFFDFILYKQQGSETKFNTYIKNETQTLAWWGKRLNGVEDEKENLKIEFLSGCREIDKHALCGKSDIEKECIEKEWIIKEKRRLEQEKQRLSEGYSELNLDQELYLTNTLNDLHIKDNPLLSLNLQLNQLLMLINNPMLFPHFAYAKRFNEIIEQAQQKVRQNVRQKADRK